MVLLVTNFLFLPDLFQTFLMWKRFVVDNVVVLASSSFHVVVAAGDDDRHLRIYSSVFRKC